MATAGPTLLGVDVLWAATLLTAMTAFSVLIAVHAALSLRDPMTKRVKALNDRREQLKAGITASTKRRAKLVQKNKTADRIRVFLSRLKVLQDSQLLVAQQKLMQAGIRKKEWAPAIIFGRLVPPIVFGGNSIWMFYGTDTFPSWGPLKCYAAVAVSFILGDKVPDIWLKNTIQKRSDAIRKGLPDALDRDRAGLPARPAFDVREPGEPGRPRCGARRRHHHDPDREVPHAPRLRAARPVRRVPQRAHDAHRGEGRAPFCRHDGAPDPVHSARLVRRYPRSCSMLDQQRLPLIGERTRTGIVERP